MSSPDLTRTIADRAIERAVADRRAEYVEEIQRILDATYRVIERTGSLDPPLRDILRESRLSTQAFYRYFGSKDELLLLLFDDGRRRLVGYLEHRMSRAGSREGRIRAWVEGVLAQASRPDAASRTRPFTANEERLATAFPEAHRASMDSLLSLLAADVPDRRDAEAIYHLAFSALRVALREGRPVSRPDVEHLARFCLAATA